MSRRPTEEERIAKQETRLEAMKRRLEAKAAKKKLADERGPSVSALNQIARDVRLLQRADALIEEAASITAAQTKQARDVLAVVVAAMSTDWRAGVEVKTRFAAKSGDSSDLAKIVQLEGGE